MTIHNVILAGVGGSGIVLVTRVLTRSAVKSGLQVRVGEAHGLAQRGGSVTSHVRIGDDEVKRVGVIVPRGAGDILVGFEPAETLRCLRLVKNKESLILVNTSTVHSPVHHARYEEYPPLDAIISVLRSHAGDLRTVNASSLAASAGNAIAENMVMLGLLIGSKRIPEISRDCVEEQLRQIVPKSLLNVNLKAFELGRRQF